MTGRSEDEDARRFADLPGWELVDRGLDDLRAGRESVGAALVASAAVRLTELGIAVPLPRPLTGANLYDLVAAEVGEDAAHSRYNALRRRLASFIRSAASAPPR